MRFSALKREGYKRSDFNLQDVLAEAGYSGFWRMAAKHWQTGFGELYRSFSKRAFVKALQRLVPEIQADDLRDGGSGVRAQALRRDGSFVDDFQFARSGECLACCNVPSPAATASIPIGQAIAKMARESFGLLARKEALAGCHQVTLKRSTWRPRGGRSAIFLAATTSAWCANRLANGG